MDEKLLEILVCPKCHSKLIYDISKEKLYCEVCNLAYNIADGIPLLLADEAESC
ncbi:Trm112 family protein [bacterium]|nr:Trm112 family protein [bacterium]